MHHYIHLLDLGGEEIYRTNRTDTEDRQLHIEKKIDRPRESVKTNELKIEQHCRDKFLILQHCCAHSAIQTAVAIK